MNLVRAIRANTVCSLLFWPLVVLAGLSIEILPIRAHGQTRFEFEHRAMGVQFRFVAYSESKATAEKAFQLAAQRAAELDQVFSDYTSESEAMRLVAGRVGEPIEVSQDLWRLLKISERFQRETEGAFDVSVGPVTRLWRLARKRHRLPDPAEIEVALKSVGSGVVTLIEPSSVVLNSTDSRLDFGGIAKGYAADECLKVLRELGINAALVAASGDLAIGAPPPGEIGWRVGIATLDGQEVSDRSLCVANCGVSTSSGSLQALEKDGVRYSHIIDPRNGLAISLHSSVTVVADCAMTSDAWATAISVLGPEHGVELAGQQSNLEAKVTYEKTSDDVQTIQTPGFDAKVDRRMP